MPKIRITNITSFLRPPGFGLDFEKKYIPPNPARPLIIDVPVIPQILEEWSALKWCKIQEADDKTPVTMESEGVSPALLNEAKASELADDLAEDDIFDTTMAREAALPVGQELAGPAPLQNLHQMQGQENRYNKATVTLGTSDRPNLGDGMSPIPGDKPVSTDNSDAFTIRAPRHNGPGAVIKSS